MCRILWTYSQWTKRKRARFTRRSINKRSRSKYGSGLTRSSHERNFRRSTMATKTSSKTAARKPVARKPVAAHKPAAPKAKVSKRKLEAHSESHARAATPVQTHAQQPASAKTAPTPRHESVSLIDKNKGHRKAEEGEIKPKRQVLPPFHGFEVRWKHRLLPQRRQ